MKTYNIAWSQVTEQNKTPLYLLYDSMILEKFHNSGPLNMNLGKLVENNASKTTRRKQLV